MTQNADVAITALTQRFLLDYPREAARKIEALPPEDVAAVLGRIPIHAVVSVWGYLTADVEQSILSHLPDAMVRHLLGELDPTYSAALLNRFDPEPRDRYLSLLDAQIAREIRTLMEYPTDSAGQLMDPRVGAFRDDQTVSDALARLRVMKRRGLREIFLLSDEGHLHGRVYVQDLVSAEPDQPLSALAQPVGTVVTDTSPREDVVEKLQHDSATDVAVVNFAGKLVGVIRQSALMSAVQDETSVDIQTMVGASKEERALSNATFAVVKRLPWLQINLLTAFLAAAVVGIFEGTIAKFTALAVLLPVVAGQSGNAGAQALAVTMRGLVLREISLRHWPKVVIKELNVGLLNGLAVAATTAIGVYVWSQSWGLVLVIASAMVISMVAAGFAGAIVPITLTRLGQDPAQSSSIILTTVTDVVGFSSFLGIATWLSSLLEGPPPPV